MKILILSILILCVVGAAARAQETQDNRIDQYAKYPGGVEEFYDYLKRNLHYPASAIRDSISGDVFIGFVLNEEGEVVKESIQVIRGLNAECDEEAIRLIKNSPRWMPARTRSKNVEQHISFPVSFRLPE